MKRKAFTLGCLLCGALLAFSWVASAEEMITESTKRHIQVGVRFSGERVFFFGTVPDPAAEVVVKLIPVETHSIRLTRKERVILFWMATKKFKIRNMPHIYKIHSSKPLQEILTPETAARYALGYASLKENMKLELLSGRPAEDDRDVMFQGFIEMKEQENLYGVAEDRIRITKGRLFEHHFTFPDKAKEGTYVVESYAVKGGRVISHSKDVIEIRKVGLTAWLYRTAQQRGVLYGIMAVMIALGAGLLVGTVFKGGGH